LADPVKVLLKQYEFLRAEIVQCIYLLNAAVLAMITVVVGSTAAISVSMQHVGVTMSAQMMVYLLLGVALLIDVLAAVYLQEQARNRRATLINAAIERLVTWHLTRKDAELRGFLCWENFIRSSLCRPLNREYYRARQLAAVIPVLLFTIPVPLALQLGLRADLGGYLGCAVASLICVTLPVTYALCYIVRQPGKEGAGRARRLRRVQRVMGALYVAGPIVVAVSSAVAPGTAVDRASLFLANAFLALLGLWAWHMSWRLTVWLSETEPCEGQVGKWLADDYIAWLECLKTPRDALRGTRPASPETGPEAQADHTTG
jgi:hypothetical protein